MEFQPADQWHKAIWTGTKTILELFKETGAFHVVMLFPERSKHHLMYLSILQRNLAILYCAQKYQAIAAEWTFFGILFNVHRLPIDMSGEPQVQIGMNLAPGTEVLHQSMWGFIDQISVLTPPQKWAILGLAGGTPVP
jgi:hypothetical protein